MSALRDAIQRSSSGNAPAPPSPPAPPGGFYINANVGSGDTDAIYVNQFKRSRGYALVSAPYDSGGAPLDTAGFPTSDFAVFLTQIATSTSAQVMHCSFGLAAADLSFAGDATGVSITNKVTTGNVTTFDVNIAAGVGLGGCSLLLQNTKRTSASATNTGCTSTPIIQSPGYALADSTVFMPAWLSFISPFHRLRLMDFSGVNNNLANGTIATHGKAGMSVTDAAQMGTLTGKKLWWNIAANADDALITYEAGILRDQFSGDVQFELGNENWNLFFTQNGYFMSGAMALVNGFSGQFGSRLLVSASRTSGIVTVITSAAPSFTVGQTVGVYGIGSGANPTPTVTACSNSGTFSFSFADAGSDGALGVTGGSSSVVGNLASELNSFDGSFDQYELQRRFSMRRTVQMANLIKAAYGSGFGTRATVFYGFQPGVAPWGALQYVSTAFGAPSNYLYSIGCSQYFFLDATSVGGPNLRNAESYNGNTPPSIADLVATMALTAGLSKSDNNYDQLAETCAVYSLRLHSYEFSDDLTGSPATAISGAAQAQKNAAMFDPAFKAPFKAFLSDMEQHGFEEITIYSASTIPVYAPNEFYCWGLAHSFSDTTTPKQLAIAETLAGTRTGITRNLLSATAATTIDGRLVNRVYSATGGNPAMEGALYNITSPSAGNYSMVLHADVTTATRHAGLKINNVVTHAYTFLTNGNNLASEAVTVTLKQGTNLIEFYRNVDYLGNLCSVASLVFTPA